MRGGRGGGVYSGRVMDTVSGIPVVNRMAARAGQVARVQWAQTAATARETVGFLRRKPRLTLLVMSLSVLATTELLTAEFLSKGTLEGNSGYTSTLVIPEIVFDYAPPILDPPRSPLEQLAQWAQGILWRTTGNGIRLQFTLMQPHFLGGGDSLSMVAWDRATQNGNGWVEPMVTGEFDAMQLLWIWVSVVWRIAWIVFVVALMLCVAAAMQGRALSAPALLKKAVFLAVVLFTAELVAREIQGGFSWVLMSAQFSAPRVFGSTIGHAVVRFVWWGSVLPVAVVAVAFARYVVHPAGFTSSARAIPRLFAGRAIPILVLGFANGTAFNCVSGVRMASFDHIAGLSGRDVVDLYLTGFLFGFIAIFAMTWLMLIVREGPVDQERQRATEAGAC